MEIVYRLGHVETGAALPLHWAYGEAFELGGWDEDTGHVELIDCRAEGCQVWTDPARMLAVAAGVVTADGDYPADEYPTILVIDADETQGSAGEWSAVRPCDVLAVRVIETAAVIAWARGCAVEEHEDGEDDDVLAEWLREHEAEVALHLATHARPVAETWIETLPVPEAITT